MRTVPTLSSSEYPRSSVGIGCERSMGEGANINIAHTPAAV
jgi:hypothetical protein